MPNVSFANSVYDIFPFNLGINPKNLRGSRVAVYTNSCISDSEAVGCDEKLTAKFWLLAHVRALLANRISYVLHLQGQKQFRNVFFFF